MTQMSLDKTLKQNYLLNQIKLSLHGRSWILSAQSYYCIHWYKFFNYYL